MKEQIALLTSEQAQKALLLFYEKLQEDTWEGLKPSIADIEFLARKLQKSESEEIKRFLASIETSGETSHGDLAKIVLEELTHYEQFRGYVEIAIKQATEPDMAPLPLIMGGLIIVFGLLAEIKKEKVVEKHKDGDKKTEIIKEKLIIKLRNPRDLVGLAGTILGIL